VGGAGKPLTGLVCGRRLVLGCLAIGHVGLVRFPLVFRHGGSVRRGVGVITHVSCSIWAE
jgi:hypothetical protein